MYNRSMPATKDSLVLEEGDRSECERILRSRKTAVNVARRAEMLVLAARGLYNRGDCFGIRCERACGWSGAQGIRAAGISRIRGSPACRSTTQQSRRARDSKGR